MVALLLSGFLVSAAFEPIGIWYLAVIGYALFFRGLRKSPMPVLFTVLFGAIVNGIVLHWSSKYVGALPWLLLTALQAAFYAPVGFVYKRSKSLLWVVFMLLLCEELRTRFPFADSVGRELPSVKSNPHSYLWFPTGEYYFSPL